MCNLETEGTKYGCGHYIATRTIAKIDCRSRYCRLSAAHPQNCSSNECLQFYGPDRSEKVTGATADYCNTCEYWYRGEGARRRR